MKTISLLALLAAAPAIAAPESVRGFEQIVRSSSTPRMTIRIDPQLTYLGRVVVTAMNGRAESEEYVFGEGVKGVLTRAFIVHFEHALPDSTLHFKYPRLRMAQVGKHEYLHQSFPVEDWDLFASPEMRAALERHNLTPSHLWLVNRYVRAVDADLRSEVILFYLEAGDSLPAPIEDLGLAGKSRALWDPIDERLTRKANALFSIVDEE